MTEEQLNLLRRAIAQTHNVRDLTHNFGSVKNAMCLMIQLVEELDAAQIEVEFLTNCYEFSYQRNNSKIGE